MRHVLSGYRWLCCCNIFFIFKLLYWTLVLTWMLCWAAMHQPLCANVTHAVCMRKVHHLDAVAVMINLCGCWFFFLIFKLFDAFEHNVLARFSSLNPKDKENTYDCHNLCFTRNTFCHMSPATPKTNFERIFWKDVPTCKSWMVQYNSHNLWWRD